MKGYHYIHNHFKALSYWQLYDDKELSGNTLLYYVTIVLQRQQQ